MKYPQLSGYSTGHGYDYQKHYKPHHEYRDHYHHHEDNFVEDILPHIFKAGSLGYRPKFGYPKERGPYYLSIN